MRIKIICTWTYLSLMYEQSQHASSLFYFNILGVDLSPLSQLNGLIKAVVQLGKSSVALVLAERMYVGVNIGIKRPVAE